MLSLCLHMWQRSLLNSNDDNDCTHFLSSVYSSSFSTLLTSCEQKFAPKCWHDIACHVEFLKIDEGLKRLELVERKMSDDSRLAMRFR